MKKLLSCILVLVFAFGITVSANDLAEYGIMVGDPNGDLRLEDNITRAEFCKMVCFAMGHDKVIVWTQQKFDDVTQSHWAFSYVNLAYDLGVIEGMGDGTFCPDETITEQDAAKILVCVLGYRPLAEELGGYPHGYMLTAAKLGFGTIRAEQPATRDVIANYFNIALDVPLMQQTGFGDKAEYAVVFDENDNPITLRTKLESNK